MIKSVLDSCERIDQGIASERAVSGRSARHPVITKHSRKASNVNSITVHTRQANYSVSRRTVQYSTVHYKYKYLRKYKYFVNEVESILVITNNPITKKPLSMLIRARRLWISIRRARRVPGRRGGPRWVRSAAAGGAARRAARRRSATRADRRPRPRPRRRSTAAASADAKVGPHPRPEAGRRSAPRHRPPRPWHRTAQLAKKAEAHSCAQYRDSLAEFEYSIETPHLRGTLNSKRMMRTSTA